MTRVLHTPRKKKSKINRREGDTIKKTEFYKAVDTRGIKPLKLVFKEENVKPSIAEKWLRLQKKLVSEAAYQRTGVFRLE